MNTDKLIESRGKDYGHPKQNYDRLAKMVSGCFTHKLQEDFTGKDMIIFMQMVKVCREAYKSKQDNRDDGRGYWDVLDLYLGDEKRCPGAKAHERNLEEWKLFHRSENDET